MASPDFSSDLDFSDSSGGSPGAVPGAGPVAVPGAGPGVVPRTGLAVGQGASQSASPGASPDAAQTAPKSLPLGPVEPPPNFLDRIKPPLYNYNMMDNIREMTDIQAMRNLLLKNFNKISGYDYLMEILCDIVKRYGRPGIYISKDTNAFLVVVELARIIDESHKKWALFDIPLKNLGLLQGSALKQMIDLSKDKLSQLIDSMEEKLRYFQDQAQVTEMEKKDLMLHNEFLKEQLDAANLRIKDLRGERFHEDAPSEQEFMEGLQMELSMREYLNSSLQEQNYKLRKTIEKYIEEVLSLQEERAGKYREHLKEVADLCKDMELHEGIRKEVVEKIETITDNPDQIVEAVNNWMKSINATIGGRQKQINELSKKAEKLSDGIAMKQIEISDMEDRNKQIIKTIEALRQETRKLGVEERFFSTALANQRKRNELLEREADSGREDALVGLSPYVGPRALERPRHWRPPRFDPARSKLLPLFEESPSSPSQTSDSFNSPEQVRRPSPEHYERHDTEISPTSFEESPGTDSGPYSYPSTPSSPTGAGVIAPGTQTLSHSPREFAPSIRPIGPSTQTLGVTNHFDIGEAFNMQTVHSSSPIPYIQETRVDSAIPEAGPSRMIDSPLNVRHKTTLTPDPYATPFISKSRFGYTDPTAKVLNIPPGAEFDVPTGMRKTMVLTSPKRKEPLLVSIDVDPKPLTQTASGEHFVCDISLAVQQANKQRYIPDRVRFRHLSPVFTFDEPPAATPTADRRQGLHTPRGIFQRKHYNIRRVHRPHEYQSPNLPWSPHDRPDARSPVSYLYPSPRIFDSSISWERGPESPYSVMDRTFDAPVMNRTWEKSPSPVIKGPYYQRRTPESDLYSSPSPVIKGPYYQRETPESDFYSSPSPVIQRPAYASQSPESLSPVIKGPSWMRRSHGQDRFEDRSQSPPMNRTYDMSSSGTRSFSSRSPSPGFDRTFESHGETSGHAQTFESRNHFSVTPRSRSGLPKHDSTFDRPNRYDRSSPQRNQTFSKTPSPRMNQTFRRSPSPQMDQAFNRTPKLGESPEENSLESCFFEEEYSPEFRTY